MYTKPIIEIEAINFEDICASSGNETVSDGMTGDGLGTAVVS